MLGNMIDTNHQCRTADPRGMSLASIDPYPEFCMGFLCFVTGRFGVIEESLRFSKLFPLANYMQNQGQRFDYCVVLQSLFRVVNISVVLRKHSQIMAFSLLY